MNNRDHVSISRVLPATVEIAYPVKTHITYPVNTLTRKQEEHIWRQVIDMDDSVPEELAINEDGSVNVLPASIQIENTTRCNLRCPMCPQSVGSVAVATLAMKDFARMLKNIGYPVQILLQGTGEPLTDPGFFAKAHFVRNMGGTVTTVTNATLLNKDRCDALYASGITLLYMSVDSAEKESYESIRIGARWESVQKNIEYLCGHSQRDQITISIFCVVQPENISHLSKMVDWAESLHINSLLFNFDVCSWGDHTLENKLKTEGRIGGIDFGVYRGLLQAIMQSRLSCSVYMPVGVAHKSGYCNFFKNTLSITVDGHVTTCCRARTVPELAMGNIFEEPLCSIWNNERFRAFRRLWLNGNPPAVCRSTCFPHASITKGKNL